MRRRSRDSDGERRSDGRTRLRVRHRRLEEHALGDTYKHQRRRTDRDGIERDDGHLEVRREGDLLDQLAERGSRGKVLNCILCCYRVRSGCCVVKYVM